jgi:hypothetical protein
MKKQITKLFITICFVFGVSMASYAQSENTWSFGPEFGFNFSKFGKDGDATDFNTGVVLGGFLTYSIRDTYAFTGKILYSQKGAKDSDSDTRLHLNYVEVPILFRLFFNREGAIRPNAFIGPSFGFLTGAQGKIGSGDYESINNYKDQYNNFDLGLGAGLGVNIRVANEMYLIFDARYTHGLSDVSKSAGDVNNQAIALTAGLSIGLSVK